MIAAEIKKRIAHLLPECAAVYISEHKTTVFTAEDSFLRKWEHLEITQCGCIGRDAALDKYSKIKELIPEAQECSFYEENDGEAGWIYTMIFDKIGEALHATKGGETTQLQ